MNRFCFHLKGLKYAAALLTIVLFAIPIAKCEVKETGQIFSLPKRTGPADSLKIRHYLTMAEKYLGAGKQGFENARLYLDSVQQAGRDLPEDLLGELQFLTARYNLETGDFSAVEENLKLAEENALKTKNFTLLGNLNLLKGAYFLRTGFFRESREAFEKSIRIASDEKIKDIAPYGYQGIANVMNAAGDSAGYRHFLNEMIKSAFSEGDTLRALGGLLGLGNSYVEGDRDRHKADSILRKCFYLSLPVKQYYFSGFSCANIGWNFYLEGNYDSSRYYYEKGLKYSIPGNFYMITSNCMGNLGNIYRDLGDREKAKTYYSEALKYATPLNDWYTVSWVYNDLHKLFLQEGDTVAAFKNFILYKQFNDSLLIRGATQRLSDARIRYEADNHKKEIALLSEKLKNNRLMNIMFAGISVVVIALSLLFINIFRINTKRKMCEINARMAEIRQANLRQQMNPHFIFNTLNSIQYFMYQHDKLATNEYLTKFSNLIRKVLDNSQHSYIPLSDELDALKLYLELESMRFRDKFEYRIVLDEEVDPMLFRIPTMLLQPYVENSICHGIIPLNKKGLIKIEISHRGDHLLCIIEDNGIGRKAGMENKKAKGIGHNSLGTRITASRLEMINAANGTNLKTLFVDLTDDAGGPAGTRVEIQIPIMT